MAVTYYIDSDNGADVNAGTSTGAAWRYLDKFTENPRDGGDKAILRRGMTNRYDDGTDLTFDSDGSVDNPIIVEADYGNAFGDDVDLSATATATLTFGSKTVTFASDISGVLAVGDWIYASGDDAKEFAYEVAVVSTVTVTLFLPYKGAQAGSGKTMTNMQSPPIWNTAAGDFQVNLDGDNWWKLQGIHFRGTDSNGVVEMDSAAPPLLKDCIFEGNGTGDTVLRFADDWIPAQIIKCRTFNAQDAILSLTGAGGFIGEARDCLFDGNSVSNSSGIKTLDGTNFRVVDCEFKNNALGDITLGAAVTFSGVAHLRNCILSSTTEVDQPDASMFGGVFIEDHDGTLNDSRQLTYLSSAEATPIIQSETTKVRSGGSTISIKCTPSTKLSIASEFSRQLLFELPIYATTASKTYTVYFASDDIAEWTANPTAGELWIELEYWGHASNNFRRITKSTGTMDFKTDTDFDQTLALTIAPAQAGVAYLRCYYAKTKESAKANIFYVDPRIAIS